MTPNDAGFTLVEVMVAMGIVLISLLGLVEAVGVATSYNIKNQLRDEAVLVGEEQMADLFRRPEATIPAFDTLSSASRVRGGGKKYIITRRTTRVPATSSYQFVVNVGWSYKNVSSHHEVQAMRTYTDGK